MNEKEARIKAIEKLVELLGEAMNERVQLDAAKLILEATTPDGKTG